MEIFFFRSLVIRLGFSTEKEKGEGKEKDRTEPGLGGIGINRMCFWGRKKKGSRGGGRRWQFFRKEVQLRGEGVNR